MKRIIQCGVVAFGLVIVATAYAGDKPGDKKAAAMTPGKCTFAKADVKKHASEHIKYPAKGSAIKQACKKEWPEEFSKEEWACIDASIKDGLEYKSANEVLKAIGAE
jgi:hypothetical protein